MMREEEINLSLDEIKSWWLLNNKPQRQQLRSGSITLPKGISLNLIESLLPYLNSKSIDTNINVLNNDDKAETSMVITSDWHVPFNDVEVNKVFINFLKDYQPDELVLNGNMNDCTAFSVHPKIREVASVLRTARKERDLWLPVAELLRDVLPNTKITYVGSQCHEGWIDKWASLSPILVDDEQYTIKNWFKLDDFGIDFEEDMYDPMGDKTFLISHGTVARSKGGNSAHAEMEMSGTSTCTGHTHRLCQVYKTNDVGEYVAFESGCQCIRQPWYYIKGRRRMMDWQQGFVLLNFKDNSFGGSCIPIIRDGDDKPYCWVGKERYR